jgi:type II secretory pathway component PulM
MIKVLSKRERLIFYATVAVIIFAVLFNLLLAPLLSKNSELSRSVNYSREKLKKYLRLISQKESILKQYKAIMPNIDLQEITQQDTLVSSLSELEAMAKNAGVRITDLRPQQKSLGKEAGQVLIEMRAEASLAAYLKFIYALENSLTLLKISKFQLTSKPNAAVLEGSFTITNLP